MDESRSLQHAAWAGAAAVLLLAAGVALCTSIGVDDPTMTDDEILTRLNDGARQAAAGVGVPLLATGVALLLWFATGLRQALDRLPGNDPLAHVIVPGAALLGGLMIAGVSIDVATGFTAWSEPEFTVDPDLARVLGTAGVVAGLTGLVGAAALVAASTRIAQRAGVLPRWAIWASYFVAVLCVAGFWTGGVGSVAFGLWVIGAVVAMLRTARHKSATV